MKQDTLPYAAVILKLLQGILYDDEKETWALFLQYQQDINKYFQRIHLQVLANLSEGYVFLEQNKQEGIPNLIENRLLSYPVTLLMVLLREKLLDLDEKGESSRLILQKKEIKAMMEVFFGENPQQMKILDRIDSYLNRLVEYGYIKRISQTPPSYEVRRILKAKITADKLAEIKQKLEEHASNL